MGESNRRDWDQVFGGSISSNFRRTGWTFCEAARTDHIFIRGYKAWCLWNLTWARFLLNDDWDSLIFKCFFTRTPGCHEALALIIPRITLMPSRQSLLISQRRLTLSKSCHLIVCIPEIWSVGFCIWNNSSIPLSQNAWGSGQRESS